MICSSVSGSPLQVIVMRENCPLVTSALTTRLSMLYPRREKTSATRTSTPGLLRTRIDIVCNGALGDGTDDGGGMPAIGERDGAGGSLRACASVSTGVRG